MLQGSTTGRQFCVRTQSNFGSEYLHLRAHETDTFNRGLEFSVNQDELSAINLSYESADDAGYFLSGSQRHGMRLMMRHCSNHVSIAYMRIIKYLPHTSPLSKPGHHLVALEPSSHDLASDNLHTSAFPNHFCYKDTLNCASCVLPMTAFVLWLSFHKPSSDDKKLPGLRPPVTVIPVHTA
ncbi:uncharacterized protein BT62DRAFT_1076292 [Guyanagaster necrorhizus]|uniref:Uncharacterized protein n=1 Tax=Guyanagaster necrorhizus TaxID=856835 RepID=A0A9P7VR25_9AGAR|nr:uncharacterized protein BT62DRAFT_1076292 [Guyanagaster necrorhizus MCA 3950]KAG7445873.1 hypothetical protein BT62DRAFT_1076292 [Guyanagaster necrorhizus MCA 3950]